MTRPKLTRDELIAKYGINNPPDPNNPIAAALLDDGRRTVAESFNFRRPDDLAMWDPTRCPELYKIARQAHADLCAAMAAGDIECVTPDGGPYDLDDVEDTATLVNFVGSPEVLVVRGDDVDVFAAMYKATWREAARRASPAGCQVRIVPVCDSLSARSLEFWPYHTGHKLLMFPICGFCRKKAEAIAEDGLKLSTIAAYEQLAEQPDPAWARTAPRWRRWWVAARRWLHPAP
jgi:hypothetical protein